VWAVSAERIDVIVCDSCRQLVPVDDLELVELAEPELWCSWCRGVSS
jgi:hypothetical protein